MGREATANESINESSMSACTATEHFNISWSSLLCPTISALLLSWLLLSITLKSTQRLLYRPLYAEDLEVLGKCNCSVLYSVYFQMPFYKLILISTSLSCLITGSSVYYRFLFGLKTNPPLQDTSKTFLTEDPGFWIYSSVAIPGGC